MVIHSNGSVIYALSQSGFMILPAGSIYDNPIAHVETNVVSLANDQCRVTADKRRAEVTVRNLGRGHLASTLQIVSTGASVTLPLGERTGPGFTQLGPGCMAAGAGGGAPGGQFPVILHHPPGGSECNYFCSFHYLVGSTSTATVQESAAVELVDINTGMSRGAAAPLEGLWLLRWVRRSPI